MTDNQLDLDAITAKWLQICGSCDAGLPMTCICPEGDGRAVIQALVDEVRRLRHEGAEERTEWGLRWTQVGVVQVREHSRRTAEMLSNNYPDDYTLLQRTITTRTLVGPWTVSEGKP